MIFTLLWCVLIGYYLHSWPANALPEHIHALIRVALATGTVVSAVFWATAWLSAEIGLARRLAGEGSERMLRPVRTGPGIVE